MPICFLISILLQIPALYISGISGTVMIDENGDRKPDYSIQIVQNGTFVTLLDYISFQNSLTKIYKAGSPNDWSGILWAGHRSSVPKGEPECGWDNEHCSSRYCYHLRYGHHLKGLVCIIEL